MGPTTQAKPIVVPDHPGAKERLLLDSTDMLLKGFKKVGRYTKISQMGIGFDWDEFIPCEGVPGEGSENISAIREMGNIGVHESVEVQRVHKGWQLTKINCNSHFLRVEPRAVKDGDQYAQCTESLD